MGRTVLVTEGDSPLGAALSRLLLSKGCDVIAAEVFGSERVTGVEGEISRKAEARSILTVPWIRRSPISARTVLLSALNAFGSIEDAFILEAPAPEASPIHKTSSADIEKAFDDAKGAVFAVRELLGYFLSRQSSVLCLVSSVRGPDATALEAGLHEGFRGFASSLLTSQANSGIVVNGFQSIGANPEEFAAFIERTLEEKARKISGRWFSYQPKGGFLQSMLAGPSRK
jgi:NAD(P)-dependent dehydrogenase (short-subunit alcohol dehydrogenase family)